MNRGSEMSTKNTRRDRVKKKNRDPSKWITDIPRYTDDGLKRTTKPIGAELRRVEHLLHQARSRFHPEPWIRKCGYPLRKEEREKKGSLVKKNILSL
jgi:hypothetical protein